MPRYEGQINRGYEEMIRKREETLSKKPFAKLLPKDIAKEIIKNGIKELELIDKDIRANTEALEKRKQELVEHHRLSWSLREKIPTHKRVWKGVEKGYIMVEGEPQLKQTAESIEHEKLAHALSRRMPAYENYLANLKSQRKAVEEVIQNAHVGTYTALVKIVEGWKNPVFLSYEIKRIYPSDETVFCDRYGNPTPDGKPVNEGIPKNPPKEMYKRNNA